MAWRASWFFHSGLGHSRSPCVPSSVPLGLQVVTKGTTVHVQEERARRPLGVCIRQQATPAFKHLQGGILCCCRTKAHAFIPERNWLLSFPDLPHGFCAWSPDTVSVSRPASGSKEAGFVGCLQSQQGKLLCPTTPGHPEQGYHSSSSSNSS